MSHYISRDALLEYYEFSSFNIPMGVGWANYPWKILEINDISEYQSTDALKGPTFVNEPPNDVTFLNTYGTIVPCSATGHPNPTVTWRTEDGTVVVNVPGLRHVRWDGSLDFPPFAQEDFRKDVHTAVYRCVAMNNAGILGSRDVRVRAGT
ncbi:down syndrome cell adhesion molecule-like protein Dscam2 [Caerostris darwini]|uniref:Down syndrome cell adhesion molecule-like protein Dscam2 n=1 Tax=Caerostris darwini TaxID=1538125 RepID=A0AAV4WRV0_9ARAC|nr:down syndrome cell adhesion molecule-like protein Dscam2 [Caerostris darwini]